MLTVMQRGLKVVPRATNAPTKGDLCDLSEQDVTALRTLNYQTGKGKRSRCYRFDEPVPDVTWGLVCHCTPGSIDTTALRALAERGRASGKPVSGVFAV